jgi:hypothetical protein
MKTLSGIVGFVVVVVIGIVGSLAFRGAFAMGSAKQAFAAQKFALEMGRYVEVEQPDFDNALKKLAGNGGQYDIEYLKEEGAPLKHYRAGRHVSIKTDKVTKSELASSAAAGESAANDPNVTYRVTSNEATDFKDVVKTFKK